MEFHTLKRHYEGLIATLEIFLWGREVVLYREVNNALEYYSGVYREVVLL